MKHRTKRRARPLAAMAACFAIGLAAGWWLHATGGPKPVITGIPGAIDGPTAEGPAPDRPANAGHDREESPGSVVSGFSRTDKPVATSGHPVVSPPPPGGEP